MSFVTIALLFVASAFIAYGVAQLFDRKRVKSGAQELSVTAPSSEGYASARSSTVKNQDVEYTCNSEKSTGWDITQKMVGLGAPALPAGHAYVFFQHITMYDPGYPGAPDRYENAVCIADLSKLRNSRFHFSRLKMTSDTEKDFLSTATRAYSSFKEDYEAEQRMRQAEEFAREREQDAINFVRNAPDMPRLGDPRPWVEDAGRGK